MDRQTGRRESIDNTLVTILSIFGRALEVPNLDVC